MIAYGYSTLILSKIEPALINNGGLARLHSGEMKNREPSSAPPEQIALVRTDMMMPVMDGAAIIQTLKSINPGCGRAPDMTGVG